MSFRFQRVPGFIGIIVSDEGEVFLPQTGSHHGHWTFGTDNGRGYKTVSISNKKHKVHRLVAMAFIPNPNNLPEVDHINRNPSDNRVENLRWATREENRRNRSDVDKLTEERRVHYWEDKNKASADYQRARRRARRGR